MKYSIALILFFLSVSTLFAQSAANKPQELRFHERMSESISHMSAEAPRIPALPADEKLPGQKSRFLGTVYSLLLPGMGELYAGKFERGRLNLIIEGILWLGFTGLSSYGGWVDDQARTFAAVHSGANFDGKDDGYRTDIENFDDIYAYNNARLNDNNLQALYPDDPSAGYYWKWDNSANRDKYETMRIKSDEMYNGANFVVIGMIANRIWSAIKASLAVRDHNSELKQNLGYLPDMQPRVTTCNGTVDGIEFQFSTRF